MSTNQILVFERPPVPRLISCAAAFASAALVFRYLADYANDIRILPILGLILLFLGTVAAMILQYGDHIYFSDIGVMYENRLLSWFGRRGYWMLWEDIIEIREVKELSLIHI